MSSLLLIVAVIAALLAVAVTDTGWQLLQDHPIATPTVVALAVGVAAFFLL